MAVKVDKLTELVHNDMTEKTTNFKGILQNRLITLRDAMVRETDKGNAILVQHLNDSITFLTEKM